MRVVHGLPQAAHNVVVPADHTFYDTSINSFAHFGSRIHMLKGNTFALFEHRWDGATRPVVVHDGYKTTDKQNSASYRFFYITDKGATW